MVFRGWDSLSTKGRALAGRGLDLWVKRRAFPQRQGVFGLVVAGLLLAVILLALRWTDPLNRAGRDLKAGRTEAAIASLLQIRARRPETARVHYLLGEAYLQAARSGMALRAYRRAIELQPAYGQDTVLLRRFADLLGPGEIGKDVSALMIQAGESAVPVLDQVLDSRQYRVRWSAVRTLEQMGKQPDYVRPYIADLQYEDCPARKRAVERLGELADRRAIAPLQDAKRRPFLENYCMVGALDRALGQLGAR